MRELVNIVNEDDQVIGEKWRDELTENDRWRIIIVWVKDVDGRHLLQQRSLTKEIHPGVWTSACAGTITANDTPLETAIRELAEEIGLQVKPDELKRSGVVKYRDPSKGFRIGYGYQLVIDHIPSEQFTIQTDELEQVKWFSSEEIEALYKNSPELFPIYDQYRELGYI